MKFVLISLLLILPLRSYGHFFFKKCLLLPIEEKGREIYAEDLFTRLEGYLTDWKWCIYKKYPDLTQNLGEDLYSLAQKTNTGSLIKLKINHRNEEDLDLYMEIVGENGEDILFKKYEKISMANTETIFSTIGEWLEAYSETIPYEARVTHVQKEFFIINAGEDFDLKYNQYVRMYRPLEKDPQDSWKVRYLGVGKVKKLKSKASYLLMLRYEPWELPKVDDWVILTKKSFQVPNIGQKIMVEEEVEEVKKLDWLISLYLDLGNGSEEINSTSGMKDFSGFMVGGILRGEVKFLKNWWVALDLNYRTGNLKSDDLLLAENKEDRSSYKIRGGYQFNFKETSFEPKLDVFIGWGFYKYSPSYIALKGPRESTVKGFLIGVRGKGTISEKFKAFIDIGTIFSQNYDDSFMVPGFDLNFGTNYLITENWSLDGSFGFIKNKLESNTDIKTINYLDISFRIGPTFSF